MADFKSLFPSNASPWLRSALKSALRRDPAEALADVTILEEILRNRCREAEEAHQDSAKMTSVESGWSHIGDVVFFGFNVDRAHLATLGRIHGWKISVVKDRKVGKWRVMAMARLPENPAQV